MLSHALLVAALNILPTSGTPGKLDIGAGPSLNHFDAPLGDIDPWIPGFNLELGVAVTGEVARSKAPKSMKDKIPKDGEIVVRPLWLAVIPSQVVLSPGGKLTTLGFTWTLLGLSTAIPLFPGVALDVGANLPEIEWLGTWGPATLSEQSFFGIGVNPNAHMKIDPSPWLRLDLGWDHHLDAPFGSFDLKGGRLLPWSWGGPYFQIHLRPGIRI